MVLPIIRNQSKTKTIPHTLFETFINSNSRRKTQKFFFELETLEIFTVAFLLKIIIRV